LSRSDNASLKFVARNDLQESIYGEVIARNFQERIWQVFKKQDGVTPVTFSELDDPLVDFLLQKMKRWSLTHPGYHPSQFFITDAEGNFGAWISKWFREKYGDQEFLLIAKSLEEKYLYIPERKVSQKTIKSLWNPLDIFPEDATFLLINGHIYERTTNRALGYVNRTVPNAARLMIMPGMGFRIIPNDWIRKYGLNTTGVEGILAEVRQIQSDRFLYTSDKDFTRAQKRYQELTGLTPYTKNFFVDVLSRIRPDVLTSAKPSILHPALIKKAEWHLKTSLSLSIEDQLLALFSIFQTEIIQNPIVNDLIAEMDATLEKNVFSRLEWDTKLNTQAVMFIMLTQHDNFDITSSEMLILPDGIEKVLEAKLGRMPTKKETYQANENYSILQSLADKHLLPESLAVSPTSLLNLSDMLLYIGEMAEYHGFSYERKRDLATVLAENQATRWQDARPNMRDSVRKERFVDSLYRMFSSTAGYVETKTNTYCLARAVEGLRRGFNVSLGKHGDSHEIISEGLGTYANKIRDHLQKIGQLDRFIGHDTEFGKTKFTPPPGATGGILFTDTRPYRRDGTRSRSKGHAAWFVITPKGEVVVYDPYYQGRTNSHTRKLDEYLSPNSGPKFWSFISKPENRVGAVFIKGDPKKLLELYNVK
jgi:hypothetical protein